MSVIGVVMAMIPGFAPKTQAATVKDCERKTPLPANITLIKPAAAVSETIARFAGAWIGLWPDLKGREALCHTLVIEEVLPNGYARVIYSIGTDAGLNIRQPNYWRVTGRIIDGALRFHLPLPDQPSLSYRFDGQTPGGNCRKREIPSKPRSDGRPGPSELRFARSRVLLLLTGYATG